MISTQCGATCGLRYASRCGCAHCGTVLQSCVTKRRDGSECISKSGTRAGNQCELDSCAVKTSEKPKMAVRCCSALLVCEYRCKEAAVVHCTASCEYSRLCCRHAGSIQLDSQHGRSGEVTVCLRQFELARRNMSCTGRFFWHVDPEQVSLPPGNQSLFHSGGLHSVYHCGAGIPLQRGGIAEYSHLGTHKVTAWEYNAEILHHTGTRLAGLSQVAACRNYPMHTGHDALAIIGVLQHMHAYQTRYTEVRCAWPPTGLANRLHATQQSRAHGAAPLCNVPHACMHGHRDSDSLGGQERHPGFPGSAPPGSRYCPCVPSSHLQQASAACSASPQLESLL